MKKAYLSVLTALLSSLAFAQEKSANIDVNINKSGGSNWFSSPILWIVGAAVFILLLVALSRSRSSE